MIRDKTIDGSYVNVRLEAKALPLRSADDNTTKPRPPPALDTQVITLRFELRDKAVTELRAELTMAHATYSKAEQAGYFGLDADARSKAMGASELSESQPVHVLVRADLDRIGPHQFEGLDLMNNDNDLREAVMTITHDNPGSPYHELETWSYVSVQQEPGPDGKPVGHDRAS